MLFLIRVHPRASACIRVYQRFVFCMVAFSVFLRASVVNSCLFLASAGTDYFNSGFNFSAQRS